MESIEPNTSAVYQENLKIENKFKTLFQDAIKIGKGGFSTVFKCKKNDLDKDFAIKIVSFELENYTKVSKEILMLSPLDNSYVVKFIDSWIEHNYFIDNHDDELAKTLDIDSLLFDKKKPLLLFIQMELCMLSLREALDILITDSKYVKDQSTLTLLGYYISSEIFYEILECVKYLHSQNPHIIHRDLKPENILLNNFGNSRFVKLSDFGLSTFHEFADQSHSKYVGTRFYKAVELNYSTKYTTKVDIYSLGVIMQELFCINLNVRNEGYDEILHPKITYLTDTISKTLDSTADKRPACGDILIEEDFWRLKNKHLSNESSLNLILTKTQHFEDFFETFIKNKYLLTASFRTSSDSNLSTSQRNINQKQRIIKIDNIDVDNVIKLINFDKLFKILQLKRFSKIFGFETPSDYKDITLKEKKNLVHNCLTKNNKEFIGILLHTAQYKAAEYIEPTVIDIIDSTKLDPERNRLTSDCPYIEIDAGLYRLVRSEHYYSMSNQFLMTRSPRGKFVIINNYLTFGTFKEMQAFRYIFYQLHFEVIVKKNLTANEIFETLQDLSQDPELANHDAFSLMIISHGTETGGIVGIDGEIIHIDTICNIFDDIRCSNLKRKPRLFFFICCHTDVYANNDFTADEYISMYTHGSLTNSRPPRLPKIIDFLICYSMIDGVAAYVDWDKCTKFGSVLCDSLISRAWTRDMNAILIRTNNTLRDVYLFDWTQSFTQVLTFNPSTPFKRKLNKEAN